MRWVHLDNIDYQQRKMRSSMVTAQSHKKTSLEAKAVDSIQPRLIYGHRQTELP